MGRRDEDRRAGRTEEKEPSPLRILACLTYYLPHRTGLTLHVQRLTEGLAARGHRVTVLSARFRRELPANEVVNGVHVVRLAAPLRISRGMVMPGDPLAVARLLRDAEIVHVHPPLLEPGLVGALARRAGRPLVITH
ncbi:MAG: glycosyltransferase, partial [Acidobacteriota bacterium]